MNFLVIPSSGVSLCNQQFAECFFLSLPLVCTISHMVGVHFFLSMDARYEHIR